QNFLIDLNLVRLLVDSAQIAPSDIVLEIGTGTGSLTGLLADRAGEVISVEVDSRMHQLASEELFGRPNVTLLLKDALRNKNHLDPSLLALLAERLAARPGASLKLVANLPYNIATPILSNLLACPTPPATMTVTIQKELAERITASPGTKDYGALTIWIQSQCRAELVRLLPPSVFWPRPKVTSAILHIERDDHLREAIGDLQFLHSFVRGLFIHRRKFLRSVLIAAHKETLGKAGVDAVLAELGLPGEYRAEQLDVPTILELARTVHRHLLASAGASEQNT
ncbi:MAG TPA: 16S rRNA (adenine(1518)-N(6)/adenine(1519)-N(6))-dimethyltransferase RsmA, partial [Pirellulales bacterium]